MTKEEPSAVKRFGLFTALERRPISLEAWDAEKLFYDELVCLGYRKWKNNTRMLNREFHKMKVGEF